MVLFFPFDLLSHYVRCLQLAQALEGERVLFPLSASYGHRVEQAGFDTFCYRGLPVQEVMEGAADFRFAWMREELLEVAFLEQVAIIDHFKPRLVIGDASFTLRMAAAYTKVPFVSLINGYMSDYYALPRKLPPHHWISKAFSFVPNRLYEGVSVRAERRVLRWLHRPFRRLAKRYGVPPRQNLLQELQGDLTLLLDLPTLFPQKHLPNNHFFLGPLCHTGMEQEPVIAQWLIEGKKTLFVSTGSSGDISRFLFLAEESFRHYQIIVSGRGGHLLRAPHVFYQEFVQLESLLPRIDLFICHGGNGTVYLALKAGIPLLCSPSNFEQEWNLQAVERMGWGARLQGGGKVKEQIQMWSHLKQEAFWKEGLPPLDMEETIRLFGEKVKKI